MEGIRKVFPGVVALDGVNFSLEYGSVHALMGENGAGKSTLMKCLFGVYKKDGGKITLMGKEVSFDKPKDALLGGVAMVHQELNQALKLSIMDNMYLGRFPKVGRLLPFISEGEMYRGTQEILSDLGIKLDPKEKMENLSVSQRQIIEIAKAVSYDAKVIVFDEPTSSLSDEEAERLFSIINRLKNDGRGIIYISHKMGEILRICDTVTVMRDGRHISTNKKEELTTEKIISLMVGRTLNERYPKRSSEIGEVLLEAEGLTAISGKPRDASFKLYRGEVLGLGGLDGSGRTELCEALFGMRRLASGKIKLGGKEVKIASTTDAKRNGLAFVTEERRKNGIFGILDIRENTTVSSLKKFRRGILISDKARSRSTYDYIKSLRTKTPSERTKIRSLSGGNQQKVIFARWLLTEPEVLILDEPTRGIDVGAKFEIYSLINRLAEDGKAIILVSSELSELFGVSDRIIVMSNGRIAGEVKSDEASQESVMRLSTKYL